MIEMSVRVCARACVCIGKSAYNELQSTKFALELCYIDLIFWLDEFVQNQ